ncbi:MAG: hypothetical protein QGH15_03655 [Kiritimatiellia bacterium]|nr:hypothetical protein [Kiritimatiellia bacterium]
MPGLSLQGFRRTYRQIPARIHALEVSHVIDITALECCLNPAILHFHGDLVAERHRNKCTEDVVVTVIPCTENIQKQVDLGWSL